MYGSRTAGSKRGEVDCSRGRRELVADLECTAAWDPMLPYGLQELRGGERACAVIAGRQGAC